MLPERRLFALLLRALFVAGACAGPWAVRSQTKTLLEGYQIPPVHTEPAKFTVESHYHGTDCPALERYPGAECPLRGSVRTAGP